jgi:FkbM family methyltransferase
MELLLGVHIYGRPFSIMQIIPKKQLEKAWFSYPSTFRAILAKYKIDLILDVGANRGQFALKTRRFYKGQIISFEPVSRVFADLRQTAPHDDKWLKFNYALGSKSEEQCINVSENDQLTSMFELNKNYIERLGAAAGSTKEPVKIRRFDDIINEIPFDISSRKIFLKMDTQGYDLEVFRGAQKIWDRIFALQSEVYQKPLYERAPLWTDVICEYEQAGFKLAGLYPHHRDGLYFQGCDCLMVK